MFSEIYLRLEPLGVECVAAALQSAGYEVRLLETRADVLLRNREVFARWARLGLRYMFIGIEAIDEEGLKYHRKRVHLGENERALEEARKLGLIVAVNIIADPDWDERRFEIVREWALAVPEIVHLTINTPYPGTESWVTDSRSFTSRDYRLFDVQHAVLPTRLPLQRFYEEFVRTQNILNRKHLGFRALYSTLGIFAPAACPRTDKLCPYAVEVQSGLQC